MPRRIFSFPGPKAATADPNRPNGLLSNTLEGLFEKVSSTKLPAPPFPISFSRGLRNGLTRGEWSERSRKSSHGGDFKSVRLPRREKKGMSRGYITALSGRGGECRFHDSTWPPFFFSPYTFSGVYFSLGTWNISGLR